MKYKLFEDCIFINYFQDSQFTKKTLKILKDQKKLNYKFEKSNVIGFQTKNIDNEYLSNKILNWSLKTLGDNFLFLGFEVLLAESCKIQDSLALAFFTSTNAGLKPVVIVGPVLLPFPVYDPNFENEDTSDQQYATMSPVKSLAELKVKTLEVGEVLFI